jgi:hypothetical protein
VSFLEKTGKLRFSFALGVDTSTLTEFVLIR